MAEKSKVPGSSKRRFSSFQGLGTFLVFVAIVIFFSFASDSFLTVDNIINILRQVSITITVACGCTLLIISGGIDLSLGSIVGLSGVTAALLITELGLPVYLAIILAIFAGGLVGLINGLIVTKINIPPLLATLGMMIALRGFVLIISGGATIFDLPESFLFLGRGYISIIPIPVVIMIVLVLIFLFIQQKTAYSIHTYAIGGNPTAAKLSGIRNDRHSISLYIITGLLCGLGGIMTASRMGCGLPTAGDGFEFDVIIAIVLGGVSIFGGTGNLQGAVLGALIVGVLTNGMIMMDVHSFWQSLARGLLLIVAVGAETIRHKKEI